MEFKLSTRYLLKFVKQGISTKRLGFSLIIAFNQLNSKTYEYGVHGCIEKFSLSQFKQFFCGALYSPQKNCFSAEHNALRKPCTYFKYVTLKYLASLEMMYSFYYKIVMYNFYVKIDFLKFTNYPLQQIH